MNSLTLSLAAKLMNAEFAGKDSVINTVSTDTRQLSKGDLFVALPGAKVDGHDCIHEAEIRGASGVVVSRTVNTTLPVLLVKNTLLALGAFAKAYRSYFQIPMLAITGSCGKTTVKEMLVSILSLQGPILANKGNLNTEVGVPLTLLSLKEEHQLAVVEMGARKKGDITYLMSLVSPNISLITNAGSAHVEIFGSEKRIAEAKGEIFQHLPVEGIAVINQDDINANYWRGLLKGQRVITFGSKEGSMISAQKINLEPMFSHFELVTDIGKCEIHLPMPGEHSISNALAAAAAARACNVSLNNIKSGLERFSAVVGRLQCKTGFQGARIIDDTYNANAISMRAALEVLSKYPGQKIFVMGDMFEVGENSQSVHHQIGMDAKNLGITTLLGVGSSTAKAVEGFGRGGIHYKDKISLIDALLHELDNNTTVLVKGSRGMRMEEVVLALTTEKRE